MIIAQIIVTSVSTRTTLLHLKLRRYQFMAQLQYGVKNQFNIYIINAS